ncbi:hypothetical protein ACPA9J_13680 [Pseudomonas aeruginosa]
MPSAGSRDNLERLLGTGEVDIALVQRRPGAPARSRAGAPVADPSARSTREPLWLFHRSNVHIDQLSDLLHLRLAIGSDGSGTRAATEAILQATRHRPGTLSDHLGSPRRQRGGRRPAGRQAGRGVHRRPGGEPGDPEIGRQRPASPGQLPPQRRLRGAPAVPQAGSRSARACSTCRATCRNETSAPCRRWPPW